MSNATTSFASFTHSPARLRLIPRRERAVPLAGSPPVLRTFGAAQLFVVTAESLPQIEALCSRRRRQDRGTIAQADRLARQMQSEFERRSARERAGRLRVVAGAAAASPAAEPAKKPATTVQTAVANRNLARIWTQVRGLARL